MKKIVLMILTACLLLGLTGCNRTVTQEEIDAIVPCTYTDGVYENTLFGLSFAAPEDWTCSDWEEILEQNEWSAEEDLQPQMIESLGKPAYYYEMFAERLDAKVSVNVCVENAAVLGSPDDTEEGYAVKMMQYNREHFENLGVERLTMTQVQEEVAGALHHGYYVTCESNGVPFYYKAMYMKEGIYVAVITTSSTGEDLTGDVLAMFQEA